MSGLIAPAQALLAGLLTLMPSHYQQDSLQALLGLFLQAKGSPFPKHSQLKSSSALNRFISRDQWPTRQVISLMHQRGVNHEIVK